MRNRIDISESDCIYQNKRESGDSGCANIMHEVYSCLGYFLSLSNSLFAVHVHVVALVDAGCIAYFTSSKETTFGSSGAFASQYTKTKKQTNVWPICNLMQRN